MAKLGFVKAGAFFYAAKHFMNRERATSLKEKNRNSIDVYQTDVTFIEYIQIILNAKLFFFVLSFFLYTFIPRS